VPVVGPVVVPSPGRGPATVPSGGGVVVCAKAGAAIRPAIHDARSKVFIVMCAYPL
jgi:hypothetical protein